MACPHADVEVFTARYHLRTHPEPAVKGAAEAAGTIVQLPGPLALLLPPAPATMSASSLRRLSSSTLSVARAMPLASFAVVANATSA
jgi:hypothetical protein